MNVELELQFQPSMPLARGGFGPSWQADARVGDTGGRSGWCRRPIDAICEALRWLSKGLAPGGELMAYQRRLALEQRQEEERRASRRRYAEAAGELEADG